TNETLFPKPVIERGAQLIRSTARNGVDRRSDEAALADVEWRDADLDLLDRLERNRRDVRALARRRSETEAVVEIRTIHRHVVQSVVLTADRTGGARLRRQTSDITETPRERRQQIG